MLATGMSVTYLWISERNIVTKALYDDEIVKCIMERITKIQK